MAIRSIITIGYSQQLEHIHIQHQGTEMQK